MSIPEAGPRLSAEKLAGGALLVATYVFLYAPILYVIYTSFSEDVIWPFPPSFSVSSYEDLFASSLYSKAPPSFPRSSPLGALSGCCAIRRAGAASPSSSFSHRCSWRTS
jgi:ABC-type spermidine/putrescine transport system permease subunit II